MTRPAVRSRGPVAALTIAMLAFGGAILAAAPASANSSFRVAWTRIGIYPRSAPDMASAKVGAALPDGAWIDVVCETTGTTVTSDVATTDIWEKLSNGTYLPNAFVETGANGWTPGVPRCDTPAPAPVQPAPVPAPVQPVPQPAPEQQPAPQQESQAPAEHVPAVPALPTVPDPLVPVPTLQPAPKAAYNGEAAAAWALEHYDDADMLDNAPDCTTFVSSALHAGGLPTTGSWMPDSFNVFDQSSFWHWFGHGWKGPTKRWGSSDFLKNYLVSEEKVATITELSGDDPSAGGARPGDVILYDWGTTGDAGIIEHAALVTAYGDGGMVIVTQKEENQRARAWAWSESSSKPISEAIPGTHFYLVHITY